MRDPRVLQSLDVLPSSACKIVEQPDLQPLAIVQLEQADLPVAQGHNPCPHGHRSDERDKDEGQLGGRRGLLRQGEGKQPRQELALLRTHEDREQGRQQRQRDAFDQPCADHQQDDERRPRAAELDQAPGEPNDLPLRCLESAHALSLAATRFCVTRASE